MCVVYSLIHLPDTHGYIHRKPQDHWMLLFFLSFLPLPTREEQQRKECFQEKRLKRARARSKNILVALSYAGPDLKF